MSFNGIGHMEQILEQVLASCINKLSNDGKLIFISSWKMDKRVHNDLLIPLIVKNNYEYEVINKSSYLMVMITKDSRRSIGVQGCGMYEK